LSAKTAQVQVPKEVEQELKLLRGFRDLARERWGYFLGRKLTQQDMNEKTKTERKAVNEARKAITGENLDNIIINSDIEGFKKALVNIKDKREIVSKKSKPFREKMSPLRKAQSYLDSVAIPDSLKELGTPVQPRFTLADWIVKALESEKASK